MAHVVLYTTAGCPFCRKAQSFLSDKKIDHQKINVSQGSDTWEEMRRKTGSGKLPQIVIGGEAIGGYSDLVALETTGELYRKLGMPLEKDAIELYDVIIVGGGPAGLSAAVYAARKILKTILISKYIGGQVTWTYDVDNYLGFSQVEAADLIAKFEAHVDHYHLEKSVGVDVTAIDLAGRIKKIVTDSGNTYHSRTVIVATGKKPRLLNVPGEKDFLGMGVSYCSTCDAPLFSGLDVAVAGGGNSALEAVIDLEKVANKVYLFSLTPLTGDQVLQDKVSAMPKVELLTDHEVTAILGQTSVEALEVKSLETGNTFQVQVSGIIIEIGLLPNSDLVIDALATNEKGEIVIDSRCRTGVPGVFACGDVTDMPYKQIIVASGEGAKAALSAYDYIINQR
jgi:alkyl hydroperoxide reductase subunit F